MTRDVTVKLLKAFGLLLLMIPMGFVPLFVYASAPHPSWGFTTSSTSTATTTFSGRAFDAQVTTTTGILPPVTMTIVDTGQLPPGGGVIDATLLTLPLPGGSADALVATTMGFDSKAQSDAAVATLSLSNIPAIEGFTISADFVMAQSIATCAGVSGSSDITNLVIAGVNNGNPIAISGSPDQTITAPGGVTVIINEQIDTSGGGTNSITVNALHIMDSTIGLDIIISSAHSDITCAPAGASEAHDFVTGGGWIPVPGGKGTFGFVAGFKDHSFTPSGHLTYIDHPAGAKVQSTDVTTYTLDAPNQRTFGGDCNFNGASGYTYSATVQDNGEPGNGNDMFSISVYDSSANLVYSAPMTLLGGGNIEIHN
jgi:hypothetical protein